MVEGFTSWHDIGPLYGLTFLFFFVIIIVAWGLNIIIKIKPPSATGGRGKSMKGGSANYASILFIIVIIIIILALLGAFGNLYGGHGVRL